VGLAGPGPADGLSALAWTGSFFITKTKGAARRQRPKPV